MAGKPREDRSSVHAKHLGIRLNEKEMGWLNAIVRRAESYWRESYGPRAIGKSAIARKASPTDVVRRLIAWEFKNNVLYGARAKVQFVDDTIAKLDHLVELANQRNAARGISEKHTRGTMLMHLIEDEFVRRELRPFAEHGSRSRYRYRRYSGNEELIGAVEVNDRFLVLRAKETQAKAEPKER